MISQPEHRPIGGYFELELPVFQEFHGHAIALNSGRSCLEYLLRCRNYKKVYVPYFTCDTVIEPISRLGIVHEFYHIDRNYRIIDLPHLNEDEALLYTNYWGLQQNYCEILVSLYGKHLILDYTQAFYCKPICGIDTFYSCRKYFGVPDGGYLYTDTKVEMDLQQDESYMRMDSLLKRIDLSPEDGYEDFRRVSLMFHGMSIKKMSKFTKRMMNSIDNNRVAWQRIENYNYLRRNLGGSELNYGDIPMVFPYFSELGSSLREYLISNKVFVARYWPNVTEWCTDESEEYWMTNHLLPLPIDQRYGRTDMQRIVMLINEFER